MRRREVKLDPAVVGPLRARIVTWRRTRRPGQAMPAELWSEAVTLADEYGIYPTCQALGVAYGGLKREMESRGACFDGTSTTAPIRGPEPNTAFVDVGVAGQLMGGPEGAILELERGDGSKLRLEIPAHLGLDVIGLSDAFFGRT